MSPSPAPLVGVSACIRQINDWDFHAVQDKYLEAVATGAGALPVLVPALGPAADIDGLLARLDGVLLTGSPSNVEPHRYGGPPSRAGVPHDPRRDATTLPLIRAAAARGVPLLAICRGCQELNVAFGGSLHQHLEEVPGRLDHRRDRNAPREQWYAPRHRVDFTPGGWLARLTGLRETTVNSLHGQGIDRLGEGLAVEAVAEDGTIEAIRAAAAPAMALGLQWHAEWQVAGNPVSAAIFAAFGTAARERARARERAAAI